VLNRERPGQLLLERESADFRVVDIIIGAVNRKFLDAPLVEVWLVNEPRGVPQARDGWIVGVCGEPHARGLGCGHACKHYFWLR
jgi:hypothetical protein